MGSTCSSFQRMPAPLRRASTTTFCLRSRRCRCRSVGLHRGTGGTGSVRDVWQGSRGWWRPPPPDPCPRPGTKLVAEFIEHALRVAMKERVELCSTPVGRFTRIGEESLGGACHVAAAVRPIDDAYCRGALQVQEFLDPVRAVHHRCHLLCLVRGSAMRLQRCLLAERDMVRFAGEVAQVRCFRTSTRSHDRADGNRLDFGPPPDERVGILSPRPR